MEGKMKRWVCLWWEGTQEEENGRMGPTRTEEDAQKIARRLISWETIKKVRVIEIGSCD